MSSSTRRRQLTTAAIVVALIAAAFVLRSIVDHRGGSQAASPAPTTSRTAPPPAPPPETTSTPTLPSTVPPTPVAPEPAASPPRFPAPFDAVDPTNPQAVLQAVITTIFSYQPGHDSTQKDAAQRAAALIAPPGVDDGFADLAPITASQWGSWAAAGDAVTATAQVPASNDNPDTPTSVARVVTVTQHVLGPDRRPVTGEDLSPITAYVAAHKQADGAWKLSKITVN